MRKQNKSMLILAILTAFVAMAVFLPGMTLTVETAEAAPPAPPRENPWKKVPAPVPKTGQTISYAAGDDGDLQMGVPWPDPRFVDHGDGTVTDKLTGLMWTKDADISNGKTTWADALSDCASCIEAGVEDWRLPNVMELQSLIDYGQYSPALPDGHPFTNVQSSPGWYWSSTTRASWTSSAYSVRLSSGTALGDDKDDNNYVWCVRRGQ